MTGCSRISSASPPPSRPTTAPPSARQSPRASIACAPDRKSTRLNSSHTVIYTLSLHDALPIYDWLQQNLERVTTAVAADDGTAIGSAIAASVNRLRTTNAKSKIVVLLTDGMNNMGKISP